MRFEKEIRIAKEIMEKALETVKRKEPKRFEFETPKYILTNK